jgi:hypothetical protein
MPGCRAGSLHFQIWKHEHDRSCSAGPDVRRHCCFEAQLHALQADPATFTSDPEDAEDFAAWSKEALSQAAAEMQGFSCESDKAWVAQAEMQGEPFQI